MQVQGGLEALRVDEVVDAAVRVTGDVRDDALARGELVETVHRHHREELVDGPAVRQGLEDAEVAVVDVGQAHVDVLQVAGHGLELHLFLGDAHDDGPEKTLRKGTLAQIHAARGEELAHLVTVVDGVVVAFLQVAQADVAVDLAHVQHGLGGVFGQLGGQLGLFHGAHVQHVEQQHGIVGHGGAAGFGDDVRVRHLLLVEDAHDGFHDVGAVFVQIVVARRDVIGVRAVVVHGQTAAQVKVAHGRAFLHQAHIKARAFHDAGADIADVGDLRAQVVVQQAEAVQHVAGLELVHHVHDLGRGKAEGGALAAGVGPVAAGLDRELGAHADVGADAQFTAAGEQNVQFAGHLQHEEQVEAQALGLQAQVDELLILVAVADDAGFGIAHQGDGGDELRLGAHFQTVMVAGAELGDLFHHLLLLVDLDGEDAAVLALIVQVLDGLAEGLVQAGDTGVQDVFHAQQHGHVIAAFTQAGDDLRYGDLRALWALRADDHVPFIGHRKKAGSPVADTVQFDGIFHPPLLQCAVFCQFLCLQHRKFRMSSRALPPRDYYARTGGKVNCPGAAVRPGRQGGQALPGRTTHLFS